MKNWASQSNTLRFLAVLEVSLVLFALAVPTWNVQLLRAAAMFGAILASQLLLHSHPIVEKEHPLEAERTRLNLA